MRGTVGAVTQHRTATWRSRLAGSHAFVHQSRTGHQPRSILTDGPKHVQYMPPLGRAERPSERMRTFSTRAIHGDTKRCMRFERQPGSWARVKSYNFGL